MPRKSRQDVRRAWSHAEGARLRLEVQEPVVEGHLDIFLDLYERRVDDMAYGVAFARQARDSVLHGGDYFAIFAFEGEDLVGGCLCQRSTEFDAVLLRFSAVDPKWRNVSLARVLHTRAFRVTREQGFGRVTLGDDPNLYGHMVKPGLSPFKARLGFDPVPAGTLGPRFSGDVADRLISLDRLTDPTVMLGYTGATDATGETSELMAYVAGANEPADLARYTTHSIRTVRPLTAPAR
ncbi:GNAT family N-acetyltransferase [Micromonospora sp. NPDC049102]|uniref:GNAT family N-acetyltransferase n=1 Tax=Micromonospora sp. NPDC049102 TaxID=3364265 RepID=UPI0037116ADB